MHIEFVSTYYKKRNLKCAKTRRRREGKFAYR